MRIPITNIILHKVYNCFVAADLLLYNVQYVDTRFRGILFLRFYFLFRLCTALDAAQYLLNTIDFIKRSHTKLLYRMIHLTAHFLPLPILYITMNVFKIWFFWISEYLLWDHIIFNYLNVYTISVLWSATLIFSKLNSFTFDFNFVY